MFRPCKQNTFIIVDSRHGSVTPITWKKTLTVFKESEFYEGVPVLRTYLNVDYAWLETWNIEKTLRKQLSMASRVL